MKIQCPECKTEYDSEALGIPSNQGQQATIECSECQLQFDVVFEAQRQRRWLGLRKKLGNSVTARPVQRRAG